MIVRNPTRSGLKIKMEVWWVELIVIGGDKDSVSGLRFGLWVSLMKSSHLREILGDITLCVNVKEDSLCGICLFQDYG